MSSDILLWILVVAVALAGGALVLQLIMLFQICRNIERTNQRIRAIITATTPLTKSILLLSAEACHGFRINIRLVRDSITLVCHGAAQIATLAQETRYRWIASGMIPKIRDTIAMLAPWPAASLPNTTAAIAAKSGARESNG